jgi:hypothetical protein
VSDEARPSRDLLAMPVRAALLWGLPLAAMLVTGVAPVGTIVRTTTWTLALTIAGVACLVNARRSRRLHCHVTGPLFLLLAAASFLHGTGVFTLGRAGWMVIGLVLTVGTVLTLVPEWIWGRYRRGSGDCC